jgi:drug/metabolite transporter (DMT)-like permease
MSATSTIIMPREARAFTNFDYLLYAAVVVLWGTSWIALHMQLGVVAPEVSLFWRFSIATAIMAGWVVITRTPMRYALSDHLRFAALGLTIFSFNFVFFYYGGLSTPSGLLAVVFSLASVFNMLLGAAFFGLRPGWRLIIAATLGFAGVGLMFAPQLSGASFGGSAFIGLLLCIGGTLSFCLGNMVSVANQRRNIPISASTTWGMAWGTLFLLAFSVARGQAFTVETTLHYLGALAWLATMASVFAFAAYMTLLRRIGAARAGYSTVLYPVVALGISTFAEGYVWSVAALAGLALVIIGNLVMLGRKA